MKKWQKITASVCLVSWTYWGYAYFKHKRVQEKTKAKAAAKVAIKKRDLVGSTDPDDQITLRVEHPSNLQDEKSLKGRTIWVSAGGQMDFYPFNGKAVDFNRSAGILLGAQKILVKDAVEQVAPRYSSTRFPDADAEVLLIFTLPDDPRNPTKEYGVAVGDREGRDYNVITDQLFFYDDPHQLYAHWGPKVWDSIDNHIASIGMTERQLQLALGQVSTPRGDIMGDRSVEFDNQGKPKLVTFSKGKASEIRDESR